MAAAFAGLLVVQEVLTDLPQGFGPALRLGEVEVLGVTHPQRCLHQGGEVGTQVAMQVTAPIQVRDKNTSSWGVLGVGPGSRASA